MWMVKDDKSEQMKRRWEKKQWKLKNEIKIGRHTKRNGMER